MLSSKSRWNVDGWNVESVVPTDSTFHLYLVG